MQGKMKASPIMIVLFWLPLLHTTTTAQQHELNPRINL